MASFLTRGLNKFIEKRFQNALTASINGFSPYGFWGGTNNAANVDVTTFTAQKLSAFYEAVTAISEDVARPGISVIFTDDKGQKRVQRNHAVVTLLDVQPNPVNTPFTLREAIVRSALITGNGYGYIVRDNSGTPVQIWFIPSEFVLPTIYNGRIFYNITYPYLNLSGTFTADQVFHYRGQGNGWIGQSVVSYAAESIANGLATQQYGNKFFASGGGMNGILELTAKDPDDLAKKKKMFMETAKQDGIGAVQAGSQTKFTATSISANDAQFIENKEFTVSDIYRWFRYADKKDFAGKLEQWQILHVTNCLSPWIVRFEQEARMKLLTYAQQPYCTIDIDEAMLMRGDAESQERRLKTKFYIGGATTNDLLADMGENTIGPEGDHRYFPVNMIRDDFQEDFWKSKSKDNIPLGSPDASGSGATNGNISQKGLKGQP
ncbi:MAG: phage portal protein [Bacteroidia bacterium]|jgi:HK97 family phage portal protein